MRRSIAILCFAVTLKNSHSEAWAGEGTLGFINNDGSRLTMLLDPPNPFVLDDDPEIPVLPGVPKGFGFLYFGAGYTHDFEPSILWRGTPTDVGLEIVGLLHNGVPVTSGFEIASGELGAFEDIYINGVPPTQRVGPGVPSLMVTSEMILDAQNGDPNDPAYENHAHVYLEADQPGSWLVTFQLRDLSGVSIYSDSEPFTVSFQAVPEPSAMPLISAGAYLVCLYRRGRISLLGR